MKKAKCQLSLLSFAVKTAPHSFVHHPSPPAKRALVEKHQPGRPRKKPQQDNDWKQQWRVRAAVCYELGSFKDMVQLLRDNNVEMEAKMMAPLL